RSWDDPTGVKKYRTEIVADNLIMLDKKGDAPSGAAPATPVTAPADSTAQPAAPTEAEINIEDIPF
ncbi:MAG: single-stranded DNA-binding protein, partial [Patescibacteria group bacterium]